MKDEREKKRMAFKSFLQSSSTDVPNVSEKRNNSDHQEVYEEELVEGINGCGNCGKSIEGKKKKNCAFCMMPICSDHLRKRRRKKNKWEKICDSCEDKFLFDAYMKLEIKAEQAMTVEEQIISMKHKTTLQLLDNKQIKRRQLSFKAKSLQQDHEDSMRALEHSQNKLQSLSNKVQSGQLMCKQLEQYTNQIGEKIRQNYEQDYRILSEEDGKLGKELKSIQKRCQQIRNAIEKREKQFQIAYEAWEKRQYRESLQSDHPTKSKKSSQCLLF